MVNHEPENNHYRDLQQTRNSASVHLNKIDLKMELYPGLIYKKVHPFSSFCYVYVGDKSQGLGVQKTSSTETTLTLLCIITYIAITRFMYYSTKQVFVDVKPQNTLKNLNNTMYLKPCYIYCVYGTILSCFILNNRGIPVSWYTSTIIGTLQLHPISKTEKMKNKAAGSFVPQTENATMGKFSGYNRSFPV